MEECSCVSWVLAIRLPQKLPLFLERLLQLPSNTNAFGASMTLRPSSCPDANYQSVSAESQGRKLFKIAVTV
jgi:hypothetical protein